ncbi:MAG: hypothetical protein CMO01_27125 [Thalassobius sp.]|nr:hypothetical protein [Thalassovita sp.]
MIVAIVDDEKHCTDRMLYLLEPYREKVRVVCFNTAAEAIKGIDHIRPEIVFLDVQLVEQTGFDVLSAISFRNFSLIFTTAYEQYAIQAFKFSAIDYLLKPIESEDFENAIQKAFKKKEQDALSERLNVLQSHISEVNASKRISIYYNEGYLFLNIKDIIRFQADVNYSHIFTVDKKKYTVSKTLKYFDDLLSDSGFFRIHNSHLINLNFVHAYSKSGFVTLLDGTQLEVSVRRKDKFMKACNAL